MLYDYLKTRFTAKWWDPAPLEQDKLDLILKCAHSAPSKQGHYDYEIFVITDSNEGQQFKQWMYWENTACLNKVVNASGPGLRRYNGQVLAPILLIWLAKKFDTLTNSYGESEWLRTNNDCMISATMAMCQAAELEVNTGFCGCMIGHQVASKLNKPNHEAVISVGFGYATPDKETSRKVYDQNGTEKGFDLSNTDPNIQYIATRKNRPPITTMINYI
jgi:nitroreductase